MRKAMDFKGLKEEDIMNIHDIRDVSPQSHMYSISFRLPEEVAFLKKGFSSNKDDIYEEFEDKSKMKMQKVEFPKE